MLKPIFEYLIYYKPRGRDVAVTCDNVHAFNRREAKRLARDVLRAGKIYKVINTGKLGADFMVSP